MAINERVLIALAVRGDDADALRLTNLIMTVAHFGSAMTGARYLVLATGETAAHIAVNRPWVEGVKLAQAKATAERLGIGFSAEQFEHSAGASEEEAQTRRAAFVMGLSLIHI